MVIVQKGVLNVVNLGIYQRIAHKIKGKKILVLNVDKRDIWLKIVLSLNKKGPKGQWLAEIVVAIINNNFYKEKKDIWYEIAPNQENKEIKVKNRNVHWYAVIVEKKVIFQKNAQNHARLFLVWKKKFALNVVELAIFLGNVLFLILLENQFKLK